MNIQVQELAGSYVYERRVCDNSIDEHYAQLTGDQILSIYTLRNLGYDLLFVRANENNCKHAILAREGVYASVCNNGLVKLNTELHIRDQS